jgi:hypothetical protein
VHQPEVPVEVLMIAARTPGVPQLRGAAELPEEVPEAVVAITELTPACYPSA